MGDGPVELFHTGATVGGPSNRMQRAFNLGNWDMVFQE